jgi:hypothetical protein
MQILQLLITCPAECGLNDLSFLLAFFPLETLIISVKSS